MVAEELKLPKTEVGKVIDATLDNIMKTVAKGDKVQIIGCAGVASSLHPVRRSGRTRDTQSIPEFAREGTPPSR